MNKKVEVQFRMERLIHDLVAAKEQEGADRREGGRLSSGGRSKGAPTDGSLEAVHEDDDCEALKKDFV